MTWIAIFVDGPMGGKDHDRMFMGEWQRGLYFMPHPVDPAQGFILVGTDSMPPDDPWPGQLHYVRDDARTQLLEHIAPGENEGWATYRLEEPQ